MKLISLLLVFILSNSIWANCPLSESALDLECKGTFKAQSIADIEAYKLDYKVKKGKAKNLKIDFNVDTSELNIASPCNIIIAKERSVKTSGNICLTSKKKVIFRHGGEITGADISLTSVGSDENSRVHIRNTKTITANNLTLKAYSRATLGHSSNYYISGNVNVETIGEGRFSSIWRDTTVNADFINISSADKTRLSKGVVLNASKVILDGTECNVNKSVIINSENIMGNCLSGEHPIARIKSDVKEGPAPLTVNFDFSKSSDDGGIVKYVFDPADGSPVVELTTASYTHTYNLAGTYKAKLVVFDEGGLKDTRKKKIKVYESQGNQAPVAAFSVSKENALVGEKIIFDASSSSDDSGIVEYAWDFSATASKDLSEPLTDYTYMEAGTYEVRLSVFDAEGLSGTTTKTITVSEDNTNDDGPKSYFKFEREADINDSGEEETFLLLEFYGEAGSTPLATAEYEILQTGQKFSPRDLFPATKTEVEGLPFGIYDVKLTVTDQAGKVDSFTHNVVLNGDDQEPILDFDLVQSGVNTAFINLLRSFDPVDFAFEFEINWGDGNITTLSDQLSATHTYSQAGTYNVNVIFSSPEVGTSTSLTKQIEVTIEDTAPLSPYANFVKWQEDFAGHVRFYQDLSASPNGELISFHWDLGNGEEAYGEEIAHFYEPGIYDVTLTVTDSMGLRDSQTQRIVITEPGPPTLVGGECWSEESYVNCFAIALDDFEELSEININWGDGSEETFIAEQSKWYEIEKQHEYSQNGTYNILITANTIRGESVSFSQSVEVFGSSGNVAPIAELTCGVDGLVVSCFNDSFDIDGQIVSSVFDMGDGTVYNISDYFFQHTYSSYGTYNITLTVTDNEGLSSSNNSFITVLGPQNEPPLADFSCENTSYQELVCNSSSLDSDGSIVGTNWNFSDGQDVSGERIGVFFEGLDVVKVTLSVQDNEGSSSSIEKDYALTAPPVPSVSFFVEEFIQSPFETISIEPTIQLEDSIESIVSFSWKLNNEEISTDELLNLENLIDGQYKIEFSVVNNFGKSAAFSSIFNVGKSPAINIIKPEVFISTNTYSFDASNSLSNTEVSELEFQWLFNGEAVGNDPILDFTFYERGENILSIIIKNNLGFESRNDILLNIENIGFFIENIADADIELGASLTIEPLISNSLSCSPELSFQTDSIDEISAIVNDNKIVLISTAIKPVKTLVKITGKCDEIQFVRSFFLNQYLVNSFEELTIAANEKVIFNDIGILSNQSMILRLKDLEFYDQKEISLKTIGVENAIIELSAPEEIVLIDENFTYTGEKIENGGVKAKKIKLTSSINGENTIEYIPSIPEDRISKSTQIKNKNGNVFNIEQRHLKEDSGKANIVLDWLRSNQLFGFLNTARTIVLVSDSDFNRRGVGGAFGVEYTRFGNIIDRPILINLSLNSSPNILYATLLHENAHAKRVADLNDDRIVNWFRSRGRFGKYIEESYANSSMVKDIYNTPVSVSLKDQIIKEYRKILRFHLRGYTSVDKMNILYQRAPNENVNSLYAGFFIDLVTDVYSKLREDYIKFEIENDSQFPLIQTYLNSKAEYDKQFLDKRSFAVEFSLPYTSSFVFPDDNKSGAINFLFKNNIVDRSIGRVGIGSNLSITPFVNAQLFKLTNPASVFSDYVLKSNKSLDASKVQLSLLSTSNTNVTLFRGGSSLPELMNGFYYYKMRESYLYPITSNYLITDSLSEDRSFFNFESFRLSFEKYEAGSLELSTSRSEIDVGLTDEEASYFVNVSDYSLGSSFYKYFNSFMLNDSQNSVELGAGETMNEYLSNKEIKVVFEGGCVPKENPEPIKKTITIRASATDPFGTPLNAKPLVITASYATICPDEP